MKRYDLREYDIEMIERLIRRNISSVIDEIQFLSAQGFTEDDPVILSLEEDLDRLRILMKKFDL